MRGFMLTVLLLLAWCISDVHPDKIKIVDAPSIHRFPLLNTNTKVLTLRVKPANISGPPHLQQLAGQCFSSKIKSYMYNVCPFHNITQKEERRAWNSFHGVLGVWREWLIENDTFTGMLFAMGERCGSRDREAKLMFNCSTITQLHNASEPSTCKYTIWMDTPLACFKGAMQVYHVLSPDHLKRWDLLDQEYYSGEITFQGLTKKRRKLFIDAGLLYDPKNDNAKEEKHKGKEANVRVETRGTPKPETNHLLSQCTKEKLQLQKELKELQDKIMNLAKDDHAFAFKFGFIQNNSQPAAAINESAPAHTTANEPTPTHFKDSMKHVAANHVKEGVVGEGRGGKRESVQEDQEDTRPIYEQLDIIGNEVEEKRTGGADHLGENRVTHQTGPQLRGPSQTHKDAHSKESKQESEPNAGGLNTREAEQETIAAQLDKSVRELLQEQQGNMGFDKDGRNPHLQRVGKREKDNEHRSERSRNVDRELTEMLEDNAELQDLLKEDA